jgi:hypothetical protein
MVLVTDDLTAQMPVKEELDRAVPPHELLDVSASKAKAELATRGGLAGRQLPTSKKGSGGLSSSSSVSLAHSITYKEGIFILLTEHYKLRVRMWTVIFQRLYAVVYCYQVSSLGSSCMCEFGCHYYLSVLY